MTNVFYKRVANTNKLRALLTFYTSARVNLYSLTTYS